METHVALEKCEDIAYLTLSCDTADKPTTLDYVTLAELAQHLTALRNQREGLRAVVLQSDSRRYFCVGANIESLKTLDAVTIEAWVARGHAVFNMIEALPLPVVARVQGYSLGGGLEMALACDLIVASREARFGQPEARLGVVAGWGGSWRLPRRVGLARAKEMFFTGRILEAEEAHRIGLIDYVGDDDQVAHYLEELFDGIRQCSPLAVGQMKQLLHAGVAGTLASACHEEARASAACLSDPATRDRIARYLERRTKA